jgi:hypothetical protein
MRTITFFRQTRHDGGIRTGIDIDDSTVLSRFESGRAKSDPSLLWYVDVRCSGPRLPTEAEIARQWLLEHESRIVALVRALANDVPVGSDHDAWPLRRIKKTQNIEYAVTCSAMRRLEAREVADIFRDVADNWSAYVGSLDAIPA